MDRIGGHGHGVPAAGKAAEPQFRGSLTLVPESAGDHCCIRDATDHCDLPFSRLSTCSAT